MVQQENYDIVAITETWWDDLHNCSAAMHGFKLFGRDTLGRRGGEVALYVRSILIVLNLIMGTIGLSLYVTESGGRPKRQMSQWESVIDHPMRIKRQIKYSISVSEKVL